ncbi:MAG: hypothetical protein PHI85_09100 [Victivallaceae bacterium]|nr:hypothetical protein [Victivallaceae bacterium]
MATSGATFIPAYYATLTAFNNDNTVTDNQVSWVEDVKHLYVGRSLYPGANTILGSSESFPAQASALVGVLYFKPATGEIRRYTTTGFDVLAAPRVTAVNASSTDDAVPTAKAVHAAITVASSALNTAINGKISNMATGSAGYVVESLAAGGVQRTSIPTSDLARKSVYSSAFSSATINNGILTLYNMGGGNMTVDLGLTGLVTSMSFNEEQSILTLWTTNNAGEAEATNINLTSLVDVYHGQGQRSFDPSAADRVTVREYYAGMTVAVGDVIRNGSSYMAMTAAGALTIGASGPNLGHTAITPVTVETGNISNDAYFELDRQLWKFKATHAGDPISGWIRLNPVTVDVNNYTITVGMNLNPDGHLMNTASGLAVSAAGTVANNDELVTGAAIVTYGGTLLTSAASTAQSKVNAASSTLNTAISNTSSALNAAKLDKPNWSTANKLVLTAANGGIQSSTYSVGGAALAGTPTSTTIATEKAVNDKINSVVSANITKWK